MDSSLSSHATHSDPSSLRIHYFRNTWIYRTVPLGQAVPFDAQELCPGCRTSLRPLCVLVSRKNGKTMRIGECGTCGYAGYMDRPSKEWMVEFYKENWDGTKENDIAAKAARVHYSLAPHRKAAIHMIADLGADTAKAVCDIGCGYGTELREFEALGFKNLLGVENSRYRAEFVKAKYGYETVVGNFESPEVIAWLKERGPIGVFFSAHVFEHIHNPEEAIRAASGLQEEGDYFILATPHAPDESAKTLVFWLPHLHSFTPMTLERMFNANGYEVIGDDFQFFDNIALIARKTASPKKRYEKNIYGSSEEKLRSFFLNNGMRPKKRYDFSWQESGEKKAVSPARIFPVRALDAVMHFLERARRSVMGRVFGKYKKTMSMATTRGFERITEGAEFPLEIQFDGDIELFVYNR